MKQPIEPSDIRKGDLIRTEANEGSVVGDNLTASEWIADGTEPSRHFGTNRLFLLDRTEPAVELPTEDHHFGWLGGPGTRLAKPGVAGEWFFGDTRITASGFSDGIERTSVTTWTPGTLVPTVALERFRHLRETRTMAMGDIDKFLAAIDEASA